MQIHLPPAWAMKVLSEGMGGQGCTLWTDLPPGLVPFIFSSSLTSLGLFKEKASNFFSMVLCAWEEVFLKIPIIHHLHGSLAQSS